jgi:hypothetical protein
MATLYTYSRSGTQIASVSDASIEQGGLDYMGGDYIMHNNNSAIVQFQLYNGGKSILSQEALRYRAGIDGRGIACSHQFLGDTDSGGDFFNHSNILVTFIDASITIDISLYNWSRGKILAMHSYGTVNVNSSVGGACFDGLYYYIVRTSSSIPSSKVVRKYMVVGKTISLIVGYNMNSLTTGTIKDIAWDSTDGTFWLVDGTTIRRFDATFSKELASWAGPAGAWGITCNDQYLFIQGT